MEKTVPNSLRVGFVRSVFPEGKIVHLFRDGMDVAASARLCWQAPLTSGRNQSKADLLRKIRDFPVWAAWPYLLVYLKDNVGRISGMSSHVRSWGPRFEGIDEAIASHSLLDVCGMQWACSVENSLRGLSSLEEGVDYLNVRYEDLVSEPEPQLRRIAEYAEIKCLDPILEFAEAKLSPSFAGFWRDHLSPDEAASVQPVVQGSMEALGYPIESMK